MVIAEGVGPAVVGEAFGLVLGGRPDGKGAGRGADGVRQGTGADGVPQGTGADGAPRVRVSREPDDRALVVRVAVDDGLPSEGYALDVTTDGPEPSAQVTGADDRGVWYGLMALAGSVRPGHDGDHAWWIGPTATRDAPALAWRGTIEGFYGPPWTHDDRLEHLAFAGRHRFNHYVYAPKDDPYHRELWREPYPDDELARLGELVRAADAARVRFVLALSPGLSMRYSDDGEHEALAAKARTLRRVGIRHLALLFDDIPTELQHPADVAAFGDHPGAAGAAHGVTCARFAEAVLRPGDGPLVMVPTDYAGGSRSPYRDQLARTLPDDVLVWWTGDDIVVGGVTREDVDRAADSYRRRLLLWDNFPVNDFDRSRLFLGPLLGRAPDLAGTALQGITANPMVEAAPSQLALATVAEWAWDPRAYDPAAAAERALAQVAGPLADAVRPLVTACGTWPPSAHQSPWLARLTDAALDGDDRARTDLRTALEDLAAVPGALERAQGRDRLAEQLAPWARAGAATAAAGLAALDLLAALDAAGGPAPGTTADGARAATRSTTAPGPADVAEALARAQEHYPNVLRGVVPPFVRAVLARAAPGARGGADRPVALVVTGGEPAPGDGSLTDLLTAGGLAVVETAGHDPLDVLQSRPPRRAPVAVVVVTRSAGAEHARRAASLAAPLVTWAHLVQLGLATRSDMLTVQDTVVLTDAVRTLPAAATNDLAPGPLTVHRGPGTVTWGETGPDGVVLARSTEGRPALVRYPPGSRLADGTSTPYGRTALFLGREGMSPWLMTDAGRALETAAVHAALADQDLAEAARADGAPAG